MIAQICSCAGGIPKDPNQFTYIVNDEKKNKKDNVDPTIRTPTTTTTSNDYPSLVSSIIEHGTDKNRLRTMTKSDLQFAASYIDPNLLRLFQYKPVVVPTSSNTIEEDTTAKYNSYEQQLNLQPIK